VFGSLRFRLPLFFLLAVALTGLVAGLIAIRLFQDYARTRALNELRQEARGIAELYGEKAGDLPISAASLEDATGDLVFFVPARRGIDPFPGAKHNLRRLDRSVLPDDVRGSEKLVTFDFRAPTSNRQLLGAGYPLRIGTATFGLIVTAKPKAELRQRWMTLFERLALAFLGGLVVAGGLGWYLSRRITEPVLALSRAADEVAGGHYDVEVPHVATHDEIGHLAERFGEMATRLREAEELERNFLMSVSHELRTPLTAIRGHVEALREGVVEDPEMTAASLDVIAAEGERLERLVGDVLDLARLDARRFTVVREEVDMKRLLDRAYASFEQEARRRTIDYRRHVDAGPVIESDGDRVLQIISNLLSNAFRWTPDGGTIALELSAANGTVAVAVQDSGPGVPPGERENIFRPFFSRDGGGTGLGLAIAHELANALGGSVDVESGTVGSRFRLVLPAEPSRVSS
jgi:signal transduction histidine kinase